MRYTILILISLLFVLSCKKDDLQINHWGTNKALKDEVTWESKPYAFLVDDIIVISFYTYSSEGFQREELSFINIPNKIGEYEIEDVESISNDDKITVRYYTYTDDGDVIGKVYKTLNDDDANIISITKIKGKQIWGNYNLTLYTSDEFTDSINFTQGEFHVKIQEER